MADTAREPPPAESTDFEELEDAEELFPEPAAADKEIEEEELSDSFDMHISVSDPEKVGDGMNAYMAYKVTTKTSVSLFKRDEFSVKRRFSDFLGLHSKLASKYLHIGYIVPPAPEKSIVGMTKVKVGKEDQSSNEFVEKRRSALERFTE
ncbi:hypothetical protein F2P81_025196 [Scophthalmus maximus]|uniref:PX domain-containing protein n=1 Tax=Scophthalmus maximus TaxID=52904 RepID=A0A6A4RT80_SCOMX|nr:hypothetical protein F2P81_025196 [Scophthalmus maximus]